jgi:hypothetical protein
VVYGVVVPKIEVVVAAFVVALTNIVVVDGQEVDADVVFGTSLGEVLATVEA